MNVFKTLSLGAGLSGLLLSAAYAGGLAGKVIGFSQIGSESGWRAAETSVTKAGAAELGIDLKFADAQQKQENQIKAIRSIEGPEDLYLTSVASDQVKEGRDPGDQGRGPEAGD